MTKDATKIVKPEYRKSRLYPEDLTDTQLEALKRHIAAEEKRYKRMRESLEKKTEPNR